MTDPWNFAGPVASLGQRNGVAGTGAAGAGTVTLVDESTFLISDAAGDVTPGGAQGLFFRDTRIISRFELRMNGAHLETLAAVGDEPFSATFVARATPRGGEGEPALLLFRSRHVGQGLREDLVLHNYAPEATYCALEIFVDCDFADLFAVKEGRAGDPDAAIERQGQPDKNCLTFSYKRATTSRGLQLHFTPAPRSMGEQSVGFEAIVGPGQSWQACIEAHPVIEGRVIPPRYRCGQPVERAAPAERLARWRRSVPHVESDHEALGPVLARSAEDLGALRIFDPDYPERVVVAAGAPWFMTVFGRDSLITSWMALIVDPDLALGVLQTLARFQGKDIDPRSDEQPGRILHEMRFGDAPTLSLGGGSIYYGTADATPLFVMLLGELRRWGLERQAVDSLLPNAERALEWIERFGDLDGDGYVEYQRATDRGLANQGWKDSWDGIRYADGSVARAPIALCEVQGYVYSAYLARAHFAREAGDDATYDRYRRKAATLKDQFNRDFWLPDRQWFAVGLDPDKKPIDSLTSNIGHCLWTGIVDEDKAAAVAHHLTSPAMFTGWGVRTLASSMPGYNPISYHCGSVWPHDTAIVAAGLARYGFFEESERLVMGLLDTAVAMGGRLPELMSGLDRQTFSAPVSYPTSCSPQAWAAASPLLCLRTILHLDPWVPYGQTWLAPRLPKGMHRLRVENIPLAGARVTVEVEGDDVNVEGLPPSLELVSTPRQPQTAAL